MISLSERGKIQEVGSLMARIERTEEEVVKALLSKIRPVMRLIDRQVPIYQLFDENQDVTHTRHLDEPGIILVNGFTFETKDSGAITFSGNQLVYTRSGGLVYLDREGIWTQYAGRSWSVKKHALDIKAALDTFGLEKIAYGATEAVKEAIRKADEKADMLQRRLDEATRLLQASGGAPTMTIRNSNTGTWETR